MECRMGCGACCIAPSISSPIPGMSEGKRAGERCVQLDDDNLCRCLVTRAVLRCVQTLMRRTMYAGIVVIKR